MSDLLITIGDSFTYGEGLQFHLWKNRYSNTFDMFKGKTSYEPCQTVSETFSEFYDFRTTNNYSGVLGKLLNIQKVSNFGNGGSNYGAIETLDIWLDYLKSEKAIQPKLFVFQFTNVIRDIGHTQNKYRSTGGIFGTEFYEDINEVKTRLQQDAEMIQCVVSNGSIENSVYFGNTQKPNLWDYADNIDTMQFLINL
jgi:hypothetical protein